MNEAVFYFFYNLAHQSTILDQVIIFFAVYFPYLVILLAAVFLVMSRRFSRDPDPKASGHHEVLKAEAPLRVFLQKKKEILGVFLVGGLAWVISKVLKIMIQAGRPFEELPGVEALLGETGFALPSNHASFFMALALCIFFFHKKAGYVFILSALVIGLARIAGGVHYPIDILGGFILGALVAYFLKKI